MSGAASLVINKDGSATVGVWGRDFNMSPDIKAVRQNLVLLVDNGQLNPELREDDTTAFGATLGNNVYVWRSGVGVTADGALVYAGGPAMSVMSLARTLQTAGAVRAMEMDINTDWVSAFTYQPNTTVPGNPIEGVKLARRHGPRRLPVPPARTPVTSSPSPPTPRSSPAAHHHDPRPPRPSPRSTKHRPSRFGVTSTAYYGTVRSTPKRRRASRETLMDRAPAAVPPDRSAGEGDGLPLGCAGARLPPIVVAARWRSCPCGARSCRTRSRCAMRRIRGVDPSHESTVVDGSRTGSSGVGKPWRTEHAASASSPCALSAEPGQRIETTDQHRRSTPTPLRPRFRLRSSEPLELVARRQVAAERVDRVPSPRRRRSTTAAEPEQRLLDRCRDGMPSTIGTSSSSKALVSWTTSPSCFARVASADR